MTLGNDLVVENYLYSYLEEHQRWYEVWEHEPYISIDVQWGDWKHDHIYIDYLMEQVGFTIIDTELTEEDGSDCYSATHMYLLNDKEKIDLATMEIIMAQDHCYWIYSNETDKYYETAVSWNKYNEEEFLERFNTIGFKLYGNTWINYEGDL